MGRNHLYRLLISLAVRSSLVFLLVVFALTESSWAQSAGTQPVQTPSRTIANIIAVLDQYKPDPAMAAAARILASGQPPENASPRDLIEFYKKRATVRESLGLTAQMLEDRRKLVELARGDSDEARYIAQLAVAELASGNLLSSLKLHESIINNSKAHPGAKRLSAYQAAMLYANLGDIPSARKVLAVGDSIYERTRWAGGWVPFASMYSALRESSAAALLRSEGKFAEAEAASRRSLAFWEEDLKIAGPRAESNPASGPVELIHAGRDFTELYLAQSQLVQGRAPEAELTMRNVLMRTLSRVGKYAPFSAAATAAFANVLNEQGRFREAAAMAREALDILDHIGAPENSMMRIVARKVLANALSGSEDWAGANEQYMALRKSAEADEYNQRVVRGSAESGLAAVKTGEAARVVVQMKSVLDENLKNLGPNHYLTGEIRGVYAMALGATGEQAKALDEFREATRVLLAPGAASTETEALAFRRLKQRHIIYAYMTLLWEIKGTEVEKNAGLNVAAESFRLADAVRGGSVQQALAASAARAAANQPGLGELIRKEQDERQEVQALYETLLRLVALPAEQQLPKVMGDMRNRIADIEKNRAQLFAEIEKRFPDYANLISPRPATIEEAVKALRPGEALMSILSTRERSFVWVLNPQGAISYHSAQLGEPEIAKIVASLRAALDPGPAPLDRLPPFNFEGAYRLYTDLFAPAQSVWGSATTIVASVSGALAQIPLSILPTEKVQLVRDRKLLLGEFRSVPWLARKAALVNIPSVTALVRLRALPAANSQRQAFVGFGDPQFSRSTPSAAGLQLASATRGIPDKRDLSISRISELTSRSAAGLDWTPYDKLPALPDTREEILSIAQALGADPKKDVFLGTEANKKKLQTMDLTQKRIVAFATHGLIAGDLPGLVQPALALAAFDDPKESPLLTLDDVLALKLDADLVVLSACNTAAGDGEGAEAISGLGRGFFYAGSRALLVTHWPVETVSAKLLTTGLFERYTTDPRLTRAEALRQSMLSLMKIDDIDPKGASSYSYAHPMFWAPYALIGDGAR